MKFEIRGGAGPYEAAAIAAVIAHISEEQAVAASAPVLRAQPSAWVAALWAEREIAGEELLSATD